MNSQRKPPTVITPTAITPTAIKQILDLGPCSDFVYDLETENHHFSAGIGELVVHNTDSSMVDLHIVDPKEVIKRGLELSKEISALLMKPLEIAFEKAMRLFCIRKKKYAAALIDSSGRQN